MSEETPLTQKRQNSVDVVIASYKETLHWASWMPAEWRVWIYRTDPDAPLWFTGPVFYIPNEGREAGQYLHHIVSNYDRLADVTLFLQGNPWDHSAPALVDLFTKRDFPHPICYVGAKPPKQEGNPKPFFDGAKEILHRAYDTIGEKELGDCIPFSVGAQFYVTREIVHRRPASFYQAILASVAYPGFAHLLEPCWGSVFDWKEKV